MKRTHLALLITIGAMGLIPIITSADTTIGAATGGLTQGDASGNALVGDQCKQALRPVYHGSEPLGITNLNPDFACRLSKYIQANPGCTIYSGWRSTAHQAALYAKSGGSGMVAPPGHSNHEKGIAADLHGPCTATTYKVAPAQFGLWFRMSFEPWHIEPNGAVAGGGAQTGGGYSASSGAGNSSGSSMPSSGGATSGGTSSGTSGGTTSTGSSGTVGAQQQLVYPSTNQGEDGGLSSDAQIKSLIGTSTYDSLTNSSSNPLDGSSLNNWNPGTQPTDIQPNTDGSQTPPDQTPADPNATPGSNNNSYTSPDMNDMVDVVANPLSSVLNMIKEELISILKQLSGQ